MRTLIDDIIDELVIEYDQETGKPKVNKLLAKKSVQRLLLYDLITMEPFTEIDMIAEENTCNLKLLERALNRDATAKIALQHRLKLYQNFLPESKLIAAGVIPDEK